MDKYDEEIERLSETAHLISDSWEECGRLFSMAENKAITSGSTWLLQDRKATGCITMIYSGGYVAQTEEATFFILDYIRDNYTLKGKDFPASGSFIKVEDLPHFAVMRREIDLLLGSAT